MNAMAKFANPFIVSGKIAPEYFCDRVNESAKLIKSVTNGNNLVLISPRRMGKTGLIQFCYDKPEIKKEYYTFFIDILHTSSLREFTYLLGRAIYETLLSRSRKMATLFIQTLKSISNPSAVLSDSTLSAISPLSTSNWVILNDLNTRWTKFSNT